MQRLARTVARLLELAPGREVLLAVSTPELTSALASLFDSAGALGLPPDAPSPVPAAVVEVARPPAPLVPAAAREPIARVAPGGTVVVIVHHAAGNPALLARNLGPLFDLDHVHGEAGPEGEHPIVVLRGTRRPQPTRARIKELRALAHALEASILVGRDGLSQGLVDSAREALARHGLIKAKLTPRARLDKEDAAVELAAAAGGQLVQRVGKTAVIYRPDVPLAPPGAPRPPAAPTADPAAKRPRARRPTSKAPSRPRSSRG